jgi:hypothetical protein
VLKQIGDTKILPQHKATCHCGSVELLINLPDGLADPMRCNCSYCSRRGAIMSLTDKENVTIVKGEDALGKYQFHTNVAEHYFCKSCGIYTHHIRRVNPDQYGFNLANLEGVDPLLIEDVVVLNGKDHPLDKAE